MSGQLTTKLGTGILQRVAVSGGFFEQAGGEPRPDATAWSIIALAACGSHQQSIDQGRQFLASLQQKDGRISITADHPEAFWPTAPAILAWQGNSTYKQAREMAINFLLTTAGHHPPPHPDSPLGHDTSIPGWPWVDATHSWVEPTALALLALGISGHGSHPRARQATQLLLDRQLPGGGWNYGNTQVFGQQLRPMPASTGLALQALADRTEQAEIESSLSYLESGIDRTLTPFSLGWGLLGLGAWGRRPTNALELIEKSLERQDLFGGYPTTHLSLMLLAATAGNGLRGLTSELKEPHRG